MNEIEKMYENAGIKRIEKSYCSKGYCIRHPNIKFGNNDTCRNCEKGHFYLFPEFTAVKQLELIKKLGNINIDIDNGCYMNSEILKVEAHCDTFEETLAEFINNLWQDLTAEEKEQIKEILE